MLSDKTLDVALRVLHVLYAVVLPAAAVVLVLVFWSQDNLNNYYRITTLPLLVLRIQNCIGFLIFLGMDGRIPAAVTLWLAFVLIISNNNLTGEPDLLSSVLRVAQFSIAVMNLAYFSLQSLTILFYGCFSIYKLLSGSIRLSQDGLENMEKDYILNYCKMAEGSQAECSICLDEDSSDKLVQLPVCKHTFHTECVMEWLNSHSKCPFCRADIRLNLMESL